MARHHGAFGFGAEFSGLNYMRIISSGIENSWYLTHKWTQSFIEKIDISTGRPAQKAQPWNLHFTGHNNHISLNLRTLCLWPVFKIKFE